MIEQMVNRMVQRHAFFTLPYWTFEECRRNAVGNSSDQSVGLDVLTFDVAQRVYEQLQTVESALWTASMGACESGSYVVNRTNMCR